MIFSSYRLDYDKTSAPVVRYQAVFFPLATAAQLGKVNSRFFIQAMQKSL